MRKKAILSEEEFHKFQHFCDNMSFKEGIDYSIDDVLADTETVFNKGPVIRAMESGGILLLDEVDLASPMLIMCLQSILEGKGYLIKKTGEWVGVKDGFQIFATANTKGIGDSSGSFVGTQILNESFLERFPVTFECSYPPKEIEKKILTKLATYCSIKNTKPFIEALLNFATEIRQSYISGSIEHTISTRRLVHILKAFSIWKTEKKAVEFCLNRFDTHTKDAFMDIFTLKMAEVEPEDDSDTGQLNIGSWEPWA